MNSTLDFAKKIFGQKNITNAETFSIRFLKKNKIVVFAPAGYADRISKAMSEAGAGVIGEYSECSFRTEGKGTFRGGKKSNPVIGKRGRLEKVEEIRLEMICEGEKLNAVIEAMLRVHPYEEPAYDVYEVFSGVRVKNPCAVKFSLRKPEPMEKILKKLNRQIEVTVFPESFVREKISHVIVDFSNDSVLALRSKHATANTLYISKIFKGSINIRLLQPGSK